MKNYTSWGKYPFASNQNIIKLFWQTQPLDMNRSGLKILSYGQGRSYGDCCLNSGGILLDTAGMDRFISFDRENGILKCETGITLDEILKYIIPAGWFLPVTPGTKFVSLGGAIANDVHGKNHHQTGTFGCHVMQLELLRSDGEQLVCSHDQNTELFYATIGGLGLTGLMLSAEIKLKKIETPFIDLEIIKFSCIEEFLEISDDSDKSHEYTVSWVDCMSSGASLGKGLFMRGNHAPVSQCPQSQTSATTRFSIPCNAPSILLNSYNIRLFNFLYYNKQRQKTKKSIVHYDPFFYPLDSIENWNKLYGKRGFLQYQFVLPHKGQSDTIRSIMETIAASKKGSFLAVLKTFGDIESPGLLSFPRKGVTLALDFPFRGDNILTLLETLDKIVKEHHGAVYPAKDARMSANSFQAFFPEWRKFSGFIDPSFSSGFWRRVTT